MSFFLPLKVDKDSNHLTSPIKDDKIHDLFYLASLEVSDAWTEDDIAYLSYAAYIQLVREKIWPSEMTDKEHFEG